MELPYAEKIGHYWKTGTSSPDQWLEKIKKVIKGMGGVVIAEGFGSSEGRSAFMISFRINEDSFKVVWPVLPSRSGDTMAAKRQAATLLYHDIKAKAMSASVLGAKTSFFSYLMLPNGRTASELATPEIESNFPLLLKNG